MENKTNLLIGLNVVMLIWLSFLSYKVMSGGLSDAELDNAKASLSVNASNNNVDPYSAKTTINNNNSNANAVKPNTAQTQAANFDPTSATTMDFEETVFDFGTIKEGESVVHVYKFKNAGTKDLEITNARGSCGCTVPQWPKEPIAPGESGEIEVKFDSKGKSGNQSKTVTIDANIFPQGSTKLTIKGEVIKEEK